jgi:hypothetical protein
MIEDRVGEVRLRVRTDLAEAAEMRPAAERIVCAALGHCAAVLEERAPGRIVFIRRLPLHWRIEEAALDDPELVGELALAAADAIERIAVPGALEPLAASDGAVLFDDEAHLRAAQLLAIARRRPAWFYEALDEEEPGGPLAALAAPQRRQIALGALTRLAAADVLAEALAAQPDAAVAVLAAALGFDTPRPPAGSPRDVFDARDSAAVLAATAAHWPALGPAGRSLALRFHAAALLNSNVETPEAAALGAAVLDRETVPSPAARDEHRDAPATPAPPLEAAAGEPENPAELTATRCAGLFYLLDRVQELDLAESLWRACLPEGAILAAAASALLGPSFAGDAAPALFGGVERPLVWPKVTAEQHAEVAIATTAALAAALPRRGLAEIPPLSIALVDHSAGRLLIAAPEGSPFAVFAWPASSPEMLRVGMRSLLNEWPHSGVLSAVPALATLDDTGRLRPREDVNPRGLMLPEAASAPAAALLAMVASAPSALFAARAGTVVDRAEAFVTRHLVRPAHIRVGPEWLEIVLGADDVDIEVRVAGLDRDPGLVPWLQRNVRFVFQKHDAR